MSPDSSSSGNGATGKPVLIVGAGMAGLTCAVYLKQAGIEAIVLEAADGVGGRVRTDTVDGFRLDRGFQILLTAYPETKRLLNYNALDLQYFRSGALIHHQTPTPEWMTLLNPFQEPLSIFKTLASPVGTFADKLRIMELLRRTQELPIDELFRQTPVTTLDFLLSMGFSGQMIERFFRPFFGGVFLEDVLTTSSNFFEFCFRMFFIGGAAIPANGIEAIPNQLASRLAPGQIRLQTPVKRIEGNTVHLNSGETLTGQAVVLAVDAAQAAQLTGRPLPTEQAFNHTTCTYFAVGPQQFTKRPPEEKLLLLNTHRSSAVHNVAILTDVASTYAPAGQTLISVSTQGLVLLDEAALTAKIRTELVNWFGEGVHQWRHLKTYHLPHALPAYTPEQAGNDAHRQPLKLSDSLYQCGDQTAYPSLNAAMQTGRQVAEMFVS
ncbi:protoporphyrinogen/coproporphyrinogen oxidase [Spirosoma fluviale]|uniref:Phytoene dehydrogenase-related protein n=1 Tax=Spirosoma fluviale TaxID=1597977 RepID=A0A286F6D4_9BACT|nr:NAD(P)/FAD-dependent oxidoreductase [Spirosoma fluviale]SOD78768.1 Phytoene dehydrogenase-related protein [Spirosoma fluviale]